jgi:hypothetical protein
MSAEFMGADNKGQFGRASMADFARRAIPFPG